MENGATEKKRKRKGRKKQKGNIKDNLMPLGAEVKRIFFAKNKGNFTDVKETFGGI